MVPTDDCQEKQGLARSRRTYRNTTTATRMPRIRTTIASRFTWFPSHDSSGSAEVSRNDGTNSTATGSDEAGGLPSFLSQSRQYVLPSDTGNPQAAHFCTRPIASGTGSVCTATDGSSSRPATDSERVDSPNGRAAASTFSPAGARSDP